MKTMVSIAADPVTEPVHQVTTLTCWRQFTQDKPTIAELLPTNTFERPDKAERIVYDETRIDY
ncbi:hypothetical protein [Nocardia brasiliensis]|uniref:hypothetical protein n=1 Tax=Nocardia brasiliensis TaxID=37326 RepID=UPI0024551A07|nr:hypothetical protein [Nocardia brasiliensis]